jgi:hypothetical protein
MEVKCQFKKDKPDEKRHKIIITGDIHKKGYATEVQHNVENRYKRSRSSEVGIRLGSSNKKSKKDIEKTDKNDVVMWGGTKDGGKNETQNSLLQIKNFVENHNQTNIIVISIPHRHDLQINSCI